MNTHDIDIELPPLPQYLLSLDNCFPGESTKILDYARAAIEPYAKRIAELEEKIEADHKLAGDLEAQLEKALTERDDYHDIADQLAEQIAAITDQEIGEHSSGNNPWQNAMLAADEWIAKDIRRLTGGVDRKRRGEPVKGTPIQEHIAKMEQDPKKKAALDRARERLRAGGIRVEAEPFYVEQPVEPVKVPSEGVKK